MISVSELRVRIFADGADLASIERLAGNPLIKGFTTNPTLMRRAGVQEYRTFARDVLSIVGGRPVSFEVFSDDFDEMERQALEIASWGENVFVKIPVTDTRGTFAGGLIERLAGRGVPVNVTALMTVGQVSDVTARLSDMVPSFVSVFAGRVADTGRDPMPLMAEAVRVLAAKRVAELIWASPRELLNVFQADAVGCQVITATPDVLAKLALVGKELLQYSLETVQMFREDAVKAGYSIDTTVATA